MINDFWQKQEPGRAIFPNVEFSKPEQKSLAGKLLIVGGNKLGFSAVGEAYQTATKLGVGEVKVALPDALKKALPTDMIEGIFLPTNISGGLSKDGLNDLLAACEWSSGVLLIGDSGQNSETAVLYETLIEKTDRQLTVTRDVIDLLRPTSEKIVNRQNTTLVISFSQAQKLFSTVYYPKILTFRMQLAQLADALHKFTLTYPATIVTFHQNHLLAAHSGRVVTQSFDAPMRMWNGQIATKAAAYLLWSPSKPIEAIATSWTA